MGQESFHKPESSEPHRIEQERSFDIGFYVTDHSPDYPDTGNPDTLRELYADIKKDGIESIRYDWHWRNVEPASGTWSEEHLGRYQEAIEVMDSVGLDAPTIILSNPPTWAVELYKQDKEIFFEAYRTYAQKVVDALMQSKGRKIERVQVLNELNNAVYTPVAVEDIPRLCEITRETFREYNPDIKLMATLLTSNTTRFVGTPIETFLPQFKKIKDSFDTVAIDYYPGLWHYPIVDALKKTMSDAIENPSRRDSPLHPKELFKDIVKNMSLLKKVFEEVATWNIDYELGEVGLPTKAYWGGEKSQQYFFDAFFRAYKHLLVELRSRGLRLPSRVGLYQAIDEAPRTPGAKILSKSPYPEHDMGLRKSGGERKRAASRLSAIIRYLRSPMQET